MLKQGAFINKRFNTLLFGCFWGNLAYAVNLMTDSIISGNALGEISLQEASKYYNWLILYSFIQICGSSLYYFTTTDGEAALVSVANVADTLRPRQLPMSETGFSGV